MRMRGFTLIESVLAIAVVGIGIVGIISALPSMVTNALLVDQTVVATNLASETLDKIIAQRDCNQSGCGYANTLASIGAGTYSANPVSEFPGYVLTSTSLEVDPNQTSTTDGFLVALNGSGYARITTQVSWNSGANSITLVTLLANY